MPKSLIMKLKYISFVALLSIFCFSTTVHANEQVDPGSFSVLAIDKIVIRQNASVLSGNVGVLLQGTSEWFDSHPEIKIGKGAFLADGTAVYGDSVKINKTASIDNVYYNDLKNRGIIRGESENRLILPLINTPPDLPTPEPGMDPISIKKGKEMTLAAGTYGELKIKKNGVLFLSGGTYQFESVFLGKNASLLIQDASEIRVNRFFKTNGNTTVSPAPGSTVDASDLTIFVFGEDQLNKKGNRFIKTVKIGRFSTIKANMIAPNGSLAVRHNSIAEGSFMGKSVYIGRNVTVTHNSALGEPSATQGLAAVSVGDLARISMSTDNIFSYEVIEGDYVGSSNSIQLKEKPGTNGHFLEEADVTTDGLSALLLRLSSGLVIAHVRDNNFAETPALFVSYLGSSPDQISGQYNMFAFSAVNGASGYGSFEISESETEMSADFMFMQLPFVIAKSQDIPYLYTAEITTDGDELKDLNLICDGNSIIIDSPVDSYLRQGFGLAVKANSLQPDDFLNLPSFYIIDMEEGPASGTFSVQDGIVKYELTFSDYTEISELILNSPNCNGIQLPNGGAGWACTDKGEVVLVDFYLGSIFIERTTYDFSLGGW